MEELTSMLSTQKRGWNIIISMCFKSKISFPENNREWCPYMREEVKVKEMNIY